MAPSLTPKVMSILEVMHPKFDRWFYTRQLAKLSKVSTWVVSREFSRLVKDGIVNVREEGREKYYRLDISDAKTRALCQLFESERRESLYNKNRRLSWALNDFTKRVFDFLPQVQSVVLFGSAARGQLRKLSDVDLLVIAPTMEQRQFNELMKSVDKLAAKTRGSYGVALSALTMTMKDFENALRERKRIAKDVLREGVVLFGEERYYLLLSELI